MKTGEVQAVLIPSGGTPARVGGCTAGIVPTLARFISSRMMVSNLPENRSPSGIQE